MFFISPIKALYSIKFYLKILQESLWKAFGFITYLFILAAIFLAIYMPIKLKPFLNTAVEQVANIMPDIKVSDGIINANNNRRIVIDSKELQGRKIIFDTASTEPAYPTQMEKENILMYVNKNTIYVSVNGNFQENTLQEDVDLEISKDILLTNKPQIVKALTYVVILIIILAVFFRIVMLTLFALVVAFIIGAATKVNLGFKKLLILALYLQAPVLILDLILFLFAW